MAAPDTDVLNIPDKKLFSYNAREVAEELCLLDAELLRKIGPSELEGGVWMKKDKVLSNYYQLIIIIIFIIVIHRRHLLLLM